MLPEQIEIGKCYDFPSGVSRRALEIRNDRGWPQVLFETLNGRRPGRRQWENLGWFAENACRSTEFK